MKIRSFRESVTGPLDNRAAMLGRETAEVFGVASDTNDKTRVLFGMLFRIKQLLAANAGDLHLHSALSEIAVYQPLEAEGNQL